MGVKSDELTVKHWQRHIAAQQVSGKSVLKYAREQGIAEHSLSYWKSKLSKTPALSSPSFVTLNSIEKELFITITAPSGLSVKVPVTIPGEKLVEVVACLVK